MYKLTVPLAEKYRVELSVMEIAGKVATDVLSSEKNILRLCEDSKGVIRVLNNTWIGLDSAQHMIKALKDASRKLAVHATNVIKPSTFA